MSFVAIYYRSEARKELAERHVDVVSAVRKGCCCNKASAAQQWLHWLGCASMQYDSFPDTNLHYAEWHCNA